MLTNYEQFALTTMMGEPDSPPRANGALCFAQDWERTAFGVALALAREGHFEWEDFRQRLIASIGAWEATHTLNDPAWHYYEQWLAALERMIVDTGLATPAEIAARAVAKEECSAPESSQP